MSKTRKNTQQKYDFTWKVVHASVHLKAFLISSDMYCLVKKHPYHFGLSF